MNKVLEVGSSRTRRLIFLIFMLGILSFSVYKLVLVDRMGFCYKRIQFVSSEELILNTIDQLMKSGRMKLDSEDASPEAYLARHPNCCSINWGGPGAFSRGLFYFGSAEVMVSYEMNKAYMSEDDSKNYQTLYYDYLANLTACGESVGYTGMSMEPPAKHKPASNF